MNCSCASFLLPFIFVQLSWALIQLLIVCYWVGGRFQKGDYLPSVRLRAEMCQNCRLGWPQIVYPPALELCRHKSALLTFIFHYIFALLIILAGLARLYNYFPIGTMFWQAPKTDPTCGFLYAFFALSDGRWRRSPLVRLIVFGGYSIGVVRKFSAELCVLPALFVNFDLHTLLILIHLHRMFTIRKTADWTH